MGVDLIGRNWHPLHYEVQKFQFDNIAFQEHRTNGDRCQQHWEDGKKTVICQAGGSFRGMDEVEVGEGMPDNAQSPAQAIIEIQVKTAQVPAVFPLASFQVFYSFLEVTKQACHVMIISATVFSAKPHRPGAGLAAQASLRPPGYSLSQTEPQIPSHRTN